MEQTNWLNAQEHAAWRSFIEGVRSLNEALDRQMQSDRGLALTYYETMIPLSEAPGRRMRMSELALATKSSRSRLSHAVSRMELRGWVVREDCATDKRGQLAILTDAGLEAIRAAAPGHVEAVRAMLIDRLDAQQLALMHQLGDILLETTESGS